MILLIPVFLRSTVPAQQGACSCMFPLTCGFHCRIKDHQTSCRFTFFLIYPLALKLCYRKGSYRDCCEQKGNLKMTTTLGFGQDRDTLCHCVFSHFLWRSACMVCCNAILNNTFILTDISEIHTLASDHSNRSHDRKRGSCSHSPDRQSEPSEHSGHSPQQTSNGR